MLIFKSDKKNKAVIVSLVAVFLFVQSAGIFWPKPVKAASMIPAGFFGGIDAKALILWDSTKDALYAASMGALISSVSYFTRRLAYDSAKYITSGGKAQGTLFQGDNMVKYMGQLASDAAANAITEFGKPFGLDLCGIPDVSLGVQLQLGFSKMYGGSGGGPGGPTPTCTWQTLRNNWSSEAFETKYGPGGSKFLSETFNSSISVKKGDFGIALAGIGAIDRITRQEVSGNLLETQLGQGFKSLTNLISGKIKSPGIIIKTEAESLTAKHQGELSMNQISGIYGSKLSLVLPMAGSVFLNTLVGDLLTKVMRTGLVSGNAGTDTDESGGGVSGSKYYGSGVIDNRIAAEKAFGFLFTTVPQKQLQSYNIVEQFAACPENPGINNCVIDTGMQTAIEEGKNGRPVTIREAIENGWLHGDWPLISPRRSIDNTSKGCYLDSKYCYSNIQKLRKARILPLGFEIAAFKADPDDLPGWTLKKIIDDFEDPLSKFYHLIDPNWIIRVPDVRCEANVFTSVIQNYDLGSRTYECTDLSTCVLEDPNGNGECLGQYGYCLQEQNAWQFGGESCPAYYASCNTYMSANNGKVNSYLSRTLDFASCSAGSLGCRAYSMEMNGGSWLSSVMASTSMKWLSPYQAVNQTIYFNDKINSESNCNNEQDGCTAFYVGYKNTTSTYKKYTENGREVLIHLQKAPDYLGCYDANLTTPLIEWPANKTEINTVSASAPEACSNFAQVCLENEVGCDAYQPVSGGPTIPGVVGGNDCPQACNGYDAFKQEGGEDIFEPAKYPVYFIPTEARVCNQIYEGCDEFTNIDTLAQGGEDLEYYTDLKYCERPTADNEGTYYSWEGSASQGYVLKVHKMLKVSNDERDYIYGLPLEDSLDELGIAIGPEEYNSFFIAGSPAYVDDSLETLALNMSVCNAAKYNTLINDPFNSLGADPDCRAFYDRDGNIYYRLLADTVVVSEACHPLRKTESYLEVDRSLNTLEACNAKSGLWSSSGDAENSCQRCTKGGKYESGACLYWTISAPDQSSSCPVTANGCRAYTGSAAGNVQQLIYDPFEPTSGNPLIDWGGQSNLVISSESIQVGLHSLQVTQNNQDSRASTIWRTFASSTLTGGNWYELSFWARGIGNKKFNIYFSQNDNVVGRFTFDQALNENINLTLGDEWREYHLGPVQFTGSSVGEVRLYFANVGDAVGSYFLDNLRLTRVEDSLYRIKNSWQKDYNGDGLKTDVPNVCDATPYDAFPGQYLGCLEYKNSFSESIYLTGFERLCREEAIGCTALYDTHNTVEGDGATERIAYNVLCKKQVAPVISSTCSKTIGNNTYSCTTLPGEDSCYINNEFGRVEPVIIPTFNYMVDSNGQILYANFDISLGDLVANLGYLNSSMNDINVNIGIVHDILFNFDSGSLLQSYLSSQFASIMGNISAIRTVLDVDSPVSYSDLQTRLSNIQTRLGYLTVLDDDTTQTVVRILPSSRSTIVNRIGVMNSLLEDLSVSRSGATDLLADADKDDVMGYISDVESQLNILSTELGINFSSDTTNQALIDLGGAVASINTATTDFNSLTGDIITQVNNAAGTGGGTGGGGLNSDITSWATNVTASARDLETLIDNIELDTSLENLIGSVGVNPALSDIQEKLDAIGANVEKMAEELTGVGLADSLFIDDSTVVVPSDTSLASPIFLTQRPEYVCDPFYRGCQKVAAETQILPYDEPNAFTHSETYIVNNPDKYSDTLCSAGEVGCGEFKVGSEISYFKDPTLYGNKTCFYKEPAQANVDGQYGWFQTGINQCYGGDKNGLICNSNTDCPNGSCKNTGDLPCYPNYLQGGSEYNIWSNGSSNYDGFVGICAPQYDQCKEFKDPLTNENSYTIFDSQITQKIEECSGQVSQKEGCVLFDMTENPDKRFDAQKTYNASESLAGENKYGFVSTQSSNYNDANIIVKVDRTRTCGEWLACKSYTTRLDENGNKVKVCYDYGVCNKTVPGVECTNWVTTPDASGERLTEKFYEGRDTSWDIKEYSGYSLFDSYQIYDLEYLYLNTALPNKPYLVYVEDDRMVSNGDNHWGCLINGVPVASGLTVKCGGEYGSGDGRCFEGKCIYPVSGDGFSKDVVGFKTAEEYSPLLTLECKGYPEIDSPLPATIVEPTGLETFYYHGSGTAYQRQQAFDVMPPYTENINICQTGVDCSCSYSKVIYGSAFVDYWPLDNNISLNIPKGICVGGGSTENQPCFEDYDCTAKNDDGTIVSSGTCQRKTREEKYKGFEGFCLQYDLSRPLVGQSQPFPCLTWLPFDTSFSGVDVYNNDPEAGYYPPLDAKSGDSAYGQVYCTEVSDSGRAVVDNRYYESNKIRDFLGYYIGSGGDSFEDEDSIANSMTGQCLGVSGFTKSGGFSSNIFACEPYTSMELRRETNPITVWPFNYINFLRFQDDRSNDNFITDTYDYVIDWAINYADADSTYNEIYEDLDHIEWHPQFLASSVPSPNPNVAVLYINNLKSYFKNLLPTLEEIIILGGNPVMHYAPDEEQYRLTDTGVKLHEQEIKKIRFAGVLLPLSKWASGNRTAYDFFVRTFVEQPDNPYPFGQEYFITSDLDIDFDQLRSDGKYNYQLVDIINARNNPGAPFNLAQLTDVTNVYVARGEVKSGGSKGRIRYIVQIPLNYEEEEVTENVVSQSMAWWFDPDNVNVTDHYAKMVLVIDFSKDTGEMITKLPFEWNVDRIPTFKAPGSGETTYMTSNEYYKFEPKDRGLAATVEFKPRCTEMVSVYDSNSELTDAKLSTNRAWTNRVWSEATELSNGSSPFGEGKITKNTDMPVYGSLDLTFSDFVLNPKWWPYGFPNASTLGRPYGCGGKMLSGPFFQEVSSLVAGYLPCSALPDDYGKDLKDYLGKTTVPGINVLSYLFADYYMVLNASSTTGIVTPTPHTDRTIPTSASDLFAQPPMIYSLNPHTCFGVDDTVNCTAGSAHNFTVNGQNGMMSDYDGDNYAGDQDADFDGVADAVIGKTNVSVKLNFFAFADKNRMPIKRVMVDWQDDSFILNEKTYGKYKNRKPFCSASDDSSVSVGVCALLDTASQSYSRVSGLTCQFDNDCQVYLVGTGYRLPAGKEIKCVTKEDRRIANFEDTDYKSSVFSDSPRACTDEYFEYTHSYSCSADDTIHAKTSNWNLISEGTKLKLLEMGNGISVNTPICIFKPRIQILDNWGFCNGSVDPATGDYRMQSGGYSQNTNSGFGNTDACLPSSENLKPWTYYQGMIVVVP